MSQDNTPQSQNFTLKSKDFTSTSKDFTLKSKDFTSTSKDFTLKSKDFNLKSKDFTSTSKDFTLKSKDFTSKSKDFTSTSKDFTSTSKDFTLKSKDFTSTSKDSTSTSKDFTLKSKDFTSKSKDNRPFPAHKFLHVKNYENTGYCDFWEKQGKIPGQDRDAICGLLDSIKGKLDGKDNVIGKYSGQIMAHIYENNGNMVEAYGVRLPVTFNGVVPSTMLLVAIPEMEYIVFEHGPFDYEEESDTVEEKLQQAIDTFDFSTMDYTPDTSRAG